MGLLVWRLCELGGIAKLVLSKLLKYYRKIIKKKPSSLYKIDNAGKATYIWTSKSLSNIVLIRICTLNAPVYLGVEEFVVTIQKE